MSSEVCIIFNRHILKFNFFPTIVNQRLEKLPNCIFDGNQIYVRSQEQDRDGRGWRKYKRKRGWEMSGGEGHALCTRITGCRGRGREMGEERGEKGGICPVHKAILH